MIRALRRLLARIGLGPVVRRDVFDRLRDVMTEEELFRWLNAPHPLLDGQTPGEAAYLGDWQALHDLATREFGVAP